MICISFSASLDSGCAAAAEAKAAAAALSDIILDKPGVDDG
jgi:hypothetical protein